jgi:nucleoside-diphosphate-sugar epimerase
LGQYNSFASYGWPETLPSDVLDQVEIVLDDVRDPGSVRGLLEGADCAYHLAALIAIPYSYQAPHSYVDTNVTGTLNVLEAVRALRTPWLVHTSTSETYGTAQTVPITEDHPINTQSPYAASKAPKPLVPIGDQHAILEIVLRQLATAGFTHCTLAIGRLGEIIRAYVGDGSQWGMAVDYATEKNPLGTMGPLLTMRERLPESFLVMNGDVLTDLDYADVLKRHRASAAPLTIATYARKVHIDFGVLTTDQSKVVAFTEKPSMDYRVSMGVYGLSRSTLDGYTPGLPLGFDELVLDCSRRRTLRTRSTSTGTGSTSAAPTTTTGRTPSSPPASRCCSREPDHRMRMLVLGFTGYLGGHVVEHLRALPGARVFGGGRSPAAELDIDLATARTDRLAKTLASAAPDAVINCAGSTDGDAVTFADVNSRGPAVLCAALREAAPSARLVHLGSAAEYGPGTPDTRVTEASATRPVTTYGATKLAGTVTVTTSGLDAVVLRVGNPVGPGAGVRARRRPDSDLRRTLDDLRVGVQQTRVDRPAPARAVLPSRLRRARGARTARRTHRARTRGGGLRSRDGRTAQSLGPVDARAGRGRLSPGPPRTPGRPHGRRPVPCWNR